MEATSIAEIIGWTVFFGVFVFGGIIGYYGEKLILRAKYGPPKRQSLMKKSKRKKRGKRK